MSSRPQPVINFTDRPEPGPLRRVMDVLQALLGKVSALTDVALLLEATGVTITDAATTPGTTVGGSQCIVDFADAGIDNMRVVVRAKNSGAGSVSVTVHDTTNDVQLGAVTVTGVTETTYAGAWTRIRPSGADQAIEARVIGDGAADPVLYAVHLQGRTLAAQA